MEMNLICMRISNSFPFEWLSTRTRFEIEACSNSEMGYCYHYSRVDDTLDSANCKFYVCSLIWFPLFGSLHSSICIFPGMNADISFKIRHPGFPS